MTHTSMLHIIPETFDLGISSSLPAAKQANKIIPLLLIGKRTYFFFNGSKLASAGSIYFLAFITAKSFYFLWSMICKLLLLFMCSTITTSDTSPSPALSHKYERNKCCLLWQSAFCLWNNDKLHHWQLWDCCNYCSPPHSSSVLQNVTIDGLE